MRSQARLRRSTRAAGRDRTLRDVDHDTWAAAGAIDAILRDNPHMHFGDSGHRGFIVVDVTPDSCVVQLRTIQDPTDRRTGVSTAATFESTPAAPARNASELRAPSVSSR